MQAPIEPTLVVQSSPAIRALILRRALRPLSDHASIPLSGDAELAPDRTRAAARGILGLPSTRTSQPAKQIESSHAKG